MLLRLFFVLVLHLRKNVKKLYFLIALFCGFLHPLFAQQSTPAFPAGFIGHWTGTMQWFQANKPAQSFKMQLIIVPTDSAGIYSWQIIYGDSAQDNRPYQLKPVDFSRGHWVVDEGNGILIDSYLHGSAFTGAFTVMGNTIIDNYELEGDRLLVQFYSVKLGEKTSSGKGTEESPLVDSYRMGSYQRGYLKKQ